LPSGAPKFSRFGMTEHTTVFKSFFQGGFECSTHKLKSGRRLDLVASTGHERWVAQDFYRCAEMGILTAREGIRWHLIQQTPGAQDFSSVLPIVRAAQKTGLQIIWDLCHFGWPDRIDVFSQAWVDALGELAHGFARFLRRETAEPQLIAPINEISFVSWAGGDVAYINPFATGRGHELKRQLVRGAIQASAVLLSELPGVRLVSPEPVIHIAGDPMRPDDVISAEQYRNSMFEAWDMLTGRLHPELGGLEKYLGIVGINYYDRNQWWNYGETIRRGDPHYRPFREILLEVYQRYRRPLFVSETGTENDDRPTWFAYICEEVRAALGGGASIQGICLYPILNHPGWDDDRHCQNGLWDYPDADGARMIYQPLADEIRRQRQIGNELYDAHYSASGKT
jgi:hypothetical protein